MVGPRLLLLLSLSMVVIMVVVIKRVFIMVIVINRVMIMGVVIIVITIRPRVLSLRISLYHYCCPFA